MNSQLLYCIKCERMVSALEHPPGELVHIDVVTLYESPFADYVECGFPAGYTFCEPPEFDMEQFMDSLVEPDEEELSVMEAG